MGRISIARVLVWVAAIALGIAALRAASDFWAGLVFLLAFGLLCAGTLGAVIDRGRDYWWLGFAIFGWAYVLAGLVPLAAGNELTMPLREVARWVQATANGGPSTVSAANAAGFGTLQAFQHRQNNAVRIGYWLTVLAFARAGAMASCLFTKGPPWRKRPTAGPSTPSRSQP